MEAESLSRRGGGGGDHDEEEGGHEDEDADANHDDEEEEGEKAPLATPLRDNELQQVAVTACVTYRTTNHIRRNKGASGEFVRQFMNQMLYEAVRDDSGLRGCCRGVVPNPSGRRRRLA